MIQRKEKSVTVHCPHGSKYGYTLQSKRDQPSRYSLFSDLWQLPNTAIDGCSGFSPDHKTISDTQYSFDGSKKLQQSLWTAAAVFLHTKYTHQPQIRGRVVNTHSSRSSDLRIVSICTAFSGFPNDRLSPCAEPPRIQRRYRPGFPPGSLFSCGTVTVSTGTQMEYLDYD